MDSIIVILLVIAAVKFVLFGGILYAVFKPDIKGYFKRKPSTQLYPTCANCHSKWTHPVDGGQTRWDGDDLVLVTMYECEHCHLPFWSVERVTTTTLQR